MAAKVYGLWHSGSERWWRDPTQRVMATPWREVAAAQLVSMRDLTLVQSSEGLTIEIIGEDGRPERPCTCRHWPCICPIEAAGAPESDPDRLPVAQPCPFCGSGSLDMDVVDPDKHYRVECMLCHARGRRGGSALSAVEGWNRRKPPWPEEKPEVTPDPAADWIAVEDQIAVNGLLPATGLPLWVRSADGDMGIAHHDEIGGIWNGDDPRLPRFDVKVTHWQPITKPEPPP